MIVASVQTFLLIQKDSPRPFDDDFVIRDFGGEAWNPLAEFQKMQEEMDQMLGNYNRHFQSNFPALNEFFKTKTSLAEMDVNEKEDRYIVRLNIPGADKSDIHVTINDRVLRVTGMLKETKEEKMGNKIVGQESQTRYFDQSTTLPGPIKAGEIQSTYNDGWLTITIPKKTGQPPKTPIKIPII